MKLKVCGLSKPVEVETCVSDKVDYCGFILNFPKSHRFITFDKARDLTKINKGNSKFVGVLVKPNERELDKFSKLNIKCFGSAFHSYDAYELKIILFLSNEIIF